MDKEKLAEQLHIWYLEATHTIPSNAYNMKAQVDYDELPEDQKHIDRYIASAILKLFNEEIDNIILDDKFAITCQTLKQYRELIRAELRNAINTEGRIYG
jgi:hypothetical protein